ncbi:MAG: T9SS type A sorting domain-containing protein [Flavobacteriales bacterium]|nr:T9SS type A sorting domain-containing protein [Flavobacteriales bacterium]
MSIRQYSANEFYFVTGYYKDTCTFGGFGVVTRIYPAIGKMDSLGQVSDVHHYVLNEGCLNMVLELEITSDKNVITWGSLFALQVDSMGTPVWARHFDGQGAFQFIKQLPSGDLLAGISMVGAGATIARLDANGNILWCKSYIRPRGVVHDCLIESDSSFIITGATDSLATTNIFDPLPWNYHPKLFMMKLDGGGDVQWCKGYVSDPNLWYSHRSSRIVQALDGNYVVLANLGAVNYNVEYRPFLMKTDLNGDTLWTRATGANGYRYSTSDLLTYTDGGFLYTGVIAGNLPDQLSGAPYIFKTDSIGFLPCMSSWHPIVVSDLFPTDSSFTLTSVDGATVHPAFVRDTIFDPIAVYDACLVTGLTQNPYSKHRRPTVRPNPNTGRFTVEFNDPLQVDSFYSVFDATGRLLYQRPLPTGATVEDIDLGHFGSGAYLLRFTTPHEVWCERVVVQ